jgi:hypothetical protein
MADRQELLPRVDFPGMRLGRHVNHDPRSLRYLVAPQGAAVTPKSVKWTRHVAPFDQGDLGSCTANATAGLLCTDPYWSTLPAEVKNALTSSDPEKNWIVPFYSEETQKDPFDGTYPPDDTGSDGLTAAKVAQGRGLISGYTHGTSLAAAHAAIQVAPFIIGIPWYQGMFNPDKNGILTISGAVAGGHEIEIEEYSLENDLWWITNSWNSSWGVKGRAAMSSATFQKLLANQGDLTAFTPITAPAPTPTPPQPQPQPQPQPPSGTSVTFSSADLAVLDSWASARHTGANGKAAATWQRGKR